MIIRACAFILAMAVGAQAADIPPNPTDGAAWQTLAAECQKTGDSLGALAAMRKALELGALPKADGLVELAALELAAGHPDNAVADLEQAIAAGYRGRNRLATDSRFSALPQERLRSLAGLVTVADPAHGVAAWEADIDYLDGEVRRLHPAMRQAGGHEAYDRELQRLRKDLPSLDDATRTARVQRLLAAVGDGHTLLFPFGMRRGAMNHIPITLYWFEDGVYIVQATDPNLIGARVESVGGRAINDVLAAMRPYISADNDMQFRWAAPFYLTFPDLVRDATSGATLDEAETWRVSVKGKDRTVHISAGALDPDTIETKLPIPPVSAPPAYLARRGENTWFESLSDGVLYVQVNTITDGETESLAAFADRLNNELKTGTARAVILDLRNNTGGDAARADRLLSVLLAYNLNGGHIVVLTSRFTFSAAMTLAARIDDWTDAVFVGEPTGTSPNHYGNEAPFKLPNTGLTGSISSGWNQPVRSSDARVWIAPDVLVTLTAADYFQGRDPMLDSARQVAARLSEH